MSVDLAAETAAYQQALEAARSARDVLLDDETLSAPLVHQDLRKAQGAMTAAWLEATPVKREPVTVGTLLFSIAYALWGSSRQLVLTHRLHMRRGHR